MNPIKITKINSWKLRLLTLLAVGIPIFTGWPLNLLENRLSFYSEKMGEIAGVTTWIIYACLVWTLVCFNVGSRKFLQYIATAFTLGFSVAITGGLTRRLPLLSGELSQDAISVRMLNIFLMIIISAPYAWMVVNSFSAKGIVDKLSRVSGRKRVIGLHIALALRVFQHVGEVIYSLMDTWKEEYPDQWGRPRHRRDWSDKWYSSVVWLGCSVHAWIFASIILAFEPIPVMVEEMEMIKNYSRR